MGGEDQCCRFSRNTAKVTPKIIYFYYPKMYLQDRSIQKIINLLLKKTSLEQTLPVHGIQKEYLLQSNPVEQSNHSQCRDSYWRKSISWISSIQKAWTETCRGTCVAEFVQILGNGTRPTLSIPSKFVTV